MMLPEHSATSNCVMQRVEISSVPMPERECAMLLPRSSRPVRLLPPRLPPLLNHLGAHLLADLHDAGLHC